MKSLAHLSGLVSRYYKQVVISAHFKFIFHIYYKIELPLLKKKTIFYIQNPPRLQL